MADEPLQPPSTDMPQVPEPILDEPAMPGPITAESPADPAAQQEDFEPAPELSHQPRRGSFAYAVLPWVLAAVVVLLLAASGGLIAAWVVATMHAVPPPALADATPSPSPPVSGEPSAEPTAASSEQPRHTPTPSPVVTQEPAPFVHVVQRGENLSYIADLYGVTVDEIVALNDITNPKLRIFPGQELLIPGYGHRPSPSPG